MVHVGLTVHNNLNLLNLSNGITINLKFLQICLYFCNICITSYTIVSYRLVKSWDKQKGREFVLDCMHKLEPKANDWHHLLLSHIIKTIFLQFFQLSSAFFLFVLDPWLILKLTFNSISMLIAPVEAQTWTPVMTHNAHLQKNLIYPI